jgi:hypothetical protein
VRGNDSVSQRRASSDPNASRLAGRRFCFAVFFFYYFRHSDLLLYGDAVAHINIARRVFDSGLPACCNWARCGLPLPHLLMIPFIFPNDVAERDRRLDPFDDRLRARGTGNLSPGARLLEAPAGREGGTNRRTS